ncbi:hypothetical protein COO91_06967 [Nostoc flagelliforme CCNUN1]|uniref:Uncharacterized protein n=1 Tax=Nostoc flagelliforme CCNUN1 TaxID=2038116 RepID=A0A2K8SZS0_9NOSO|nr:hypothetical protein COO91_06967 [Nostoc flagelliforme CCNUN1]
MSKFCPKSYIIYPCLGKTKMLSPPNMEEASEDWDFQEAREGW